MNQEEGDVVRNVADRDELVGLARELLAAVETYYPAQLPAGTAEQLVWAAGLMARCHALLDGMTALAAQGHDDSVPALYRPLLETYLTGMYALFGNDEDVAVLRAAWAHDVHEMEKALGRHPARPESAQPLRVSDYKHATGLVDRVDAILKDVEPASSGWARKAYKYHYKTTSFHDSHGGLGSTTGHMTDERDGSTTVSLRRDGAAVSLHLLAMAVSLALGLALSWASRAGRDPSAVAAVQQRWTQLVAVSPDGRRRR